MSEADEHWRQTALALWQEDNGATWLPVNGRSMWPLIQPGDKVLVTPDWQPPRRGRVITFRQGSSLNTHRLLRWQNVGGQLMLTTKGDNVWELDSPINADAVIGSVQRVQGDGREWNVNGRFWQIVNWWLAWMMLAQTAMYHYITRWLRPGRRFWNRPPLRRLFRAPLTIFLLLLRVFTKKPWGREA